MDHQPSSRTPTLLHLPPAVLSHITSLCPCYAKRQFRSSCKTLRTIATPALMRLIADSVKVRTQDLRLSKQLAQSWDKATTAKIRDVVSFHLRSRSDEEEDDGCDDGSEGIVDECEIYNRQRKSGEGFSEESDWDNDSDDYDDDRDDYDDESDGYDDGDGGDGMGKGAGRGRKCGASSSSGHGRSDSPQKPCSLICRDIEGAVLAAMRHWTQLLSVDALWSEPGVTHQLVSHCTRLRHLKLSMPDADYYRDSPHYLDYALYDLHRLSHLQDLELSEVELESKHYRALGSLTRLHSFVWEGTFTGDFTVGLATLTQLTRLELKLETRIQARQQNQGCGRRGRGGRLHNYIQQPHHHHHNHNPNGPGVVGDGAPMLGALALVGLQHLSIHVKWYMEGRGYRNVSDHMDLYNMFGASRSLTHLAPITGGFKGGDLGSWGQLACLELDRDSVVDDAMAVHLSACSCLTSLKVGELGLSLSCSATLPHLRFLQVNVLCSDAPLSNFAPNLLTLTLTLTPFGRSMSPLHDHVNHLNHVNHFTTLLEGHPTLSHIHIPIQLLTAPSMPCSPLSTLQALTHMVVFASPWMPQTSSCLRTSAALHFPGIKELVVTPRCIRREAHHVPAILSSMPNLTRVRIPFSMFWKGDVYQENTWQGEIYQEVTSALCSLKELCVLELLPDMIRVDDCGRHAEVGKTVSDAGDRLSVFLVALACCPCLRFVYLMDDELCSDVFLECFAGSDSEQQVLGSVRRQVEAAEATGLLRFEVMWK